MANFQYDPPTGPISGVSFEEQTELAINDLHSRVDSAESDIAEADDAANQALTSANEAKEQAGQAQTTADGAVTSIAQINQNLSDTTTTANNAMSRANDAFDLAATAGSSTGQVSVGLSNHISNTSNPHHVTAEQVGAVTPTDLSNALGGISQQIQGAMGTFTVSTGPVDLNGEYLGAEKLFLTSAANLNLPPDVTAPVWLMVYVTSDGTGVTQRCWDNSGTLLIYERTGAVNNSDPENPVVTWYPWNTIATPTVVKSVSVETDPAGQPAGIYLVFVMDTESGDETTYLNMSQVAGGGYTSGNGAVNISADNKISLQLDVAKSSGLTVSAAGLQTVAALSATNGVPSSGVPGVVFPDGSTLDVTAEGMMSVDPHNADQAAHAALFGTKIRRRLAGDTTYYLRADGNDSNDGLSAAAAFATLPRFLAELNRIDGAGFALTLDMGAGDFPGQFRIQGSFVGVKFLTIRGTGNTTTIGQFVITAEMTAVPDSRYVSGIPPVAVENIAFTAELIMSGLCSATFRNVSFLNVTAFIINVFLGAIARFYGSLTFGGSGVTYACFYPTVRGHIELTGLTVNFADGLQFRPGYGFITAHSGAMVVIQSNLVTNGSPTGPKYRLESGSGIKTGVGDQIIPGTLPGTQDATSWLV